MKQIRNSTQRNEAVSSLLQAMAGVTMPPISGGLPTGQSAAAKYPPVTRIQMCEPQPYFGIGASIPAA